jgi:branched-chain amino acid transport system permease protein
MSSTLLIIQTLNGLQLGVLLFLVAAGLTLVFGVMDFINLAHGVQYMLGAYLAAMFVAWTGNFASASPSQLLTALALRPAARGAGVPPPLRPRHLDQVLATFGLILFVNEGVKIVWGAAPLQVPMPALALRHHRAWPTASSIRSGASPSSPRAWRCARPLSRGGEDPVGMLVRAGATNAPMVSALGVDINKLFMIVFAFGTMLAGFAGAWPRRSSRSSRAWATPC